MKRLLFFPILILCATALLAADRAWQAITRTGSVTTNAEIMVVESTGDGETPYRASIGALSALQQKVSGAGSITNVIYAATDAAIDGAGFELSPRAISSQALLSNLFWHLPNGTRLVVSGPALPIFGETNTTASGTATHSTGALKLIGKSDITISGLRLTQTNYADTVFVTACTNVTFEDCVLTLTPTHTTTLSYLQGAFSLQSPTRNIQFVRCTITGAPNHGIVHWGGQQDHDRLVVENCTFGSIGNTNHPTLGYDGAAVVVSGSRSSTIIRGNHFADCIRPIEIYGFASAPSPISGILIQGNTMTNVLQHGVSSFDDGTNWIQGLDISGNSIFVRNLSIPAGGVNGISLVAAARGVTIAGNHIQSDPVPSGAVSAKIGINVSASAGSGGAIEDVRIIGNSIAGNWSQRGIQIYGVADGTGGSFTTLSNYVVTGNIIKEATTGILSGGQQGLIAHNLIGTTTYGIDVQNARDLRIFDNTVLSGTAVYFSHATTTNVIMQGNSWAHSSINNTAGAVNVTLNEQSPYTWISGGGATLTNGGIVLSGGPQILSVSNNVAPNGSLLLNSDGRFYLRTNNAWLLK